MRRHRHKNEEVELDITSFMNLMIILVPVLLISMVFNHISVLDLRLPLEETLEQQNLDIDELNLEVIVREQGFNVMLGPVSIEEIAKQDTQYDFNRLSVILQNLKKKLGNERRDIAILSEPNIDYQILVNVIDTAKSFPAVIATSVVDAVLFPDVSLGDAPIKEVTP